MKKICIGMVFVALFFVSCTFANNGNDDWTVEVAEFSRTPSVTQGA